MIVRTVWAGETACPTLLAAMSRLLLVLVGEAVSPALCFAWALFLVPAVHATELRIHDGRVEALSDGRRMLSSPSEGLWTVACDWRDSWPQDWQTAKPGAAETVGGWTVVKGELNACGAAWQFQDSYRRQGYVVKAIRRYTWKAAKPLSKVTLTVRFQTEPGKAAPLLPGILYEGNPNGARSGRVPVYTGAPREEAIYEEHRYPMPFAFVETGKTGAALHTLPSPAPFGNLRDQWWSLGVVARPDRTELILLSGPCASNGKHSIIKGQQRGFLPYDNAWLNLPAEGTIEKTFYLEGIPVEREGSGFERAVDTSLDIFAPYSVEGMPTFAEIIRDKYRLAQSRWHAPGFRKYVDRPVFVMGWTGQAEAPGYALQVLAPGLHDPEALQMAQRSLDFLTSAEFYEQGFHNWYDYEKKQWYEKEPLNQAQAMLNFANAIRVGRKHGMQTARWETFLRKASDLHAARILADSWKPPSTVEAFFIAPLVRSFELFGVEQYRRAALKAARFYADRHLSMREPYWGGTSDASCEDKEGAYGAMQGFLALYDITHDPEHLRWARHAADVVLTYVVVWDIDLPPGRLRDHGLRTRGWTSVSVQNQHLDVFGVLIAADLYHLGQILKDDKLRRTAILMYRSCGQLIDPWGSQGEQLQETNYVQTRGEVPDLTNMRGGYNERWTVFWITAHFLNGAAQLAEMGVPIWE
jgi:hypothetical protein